MTRTDQLTLQLDLDRPGLPVDLRPMLPRSVAEPYDDGDDLFEPWWGGERAFAAVEVDPASGAGSVRIVGRNGRDLGATLPELTGPGGLVGRLGGRSAILDGCLVVTGRDGRPNPAALAARLTGRSDETVVYLAFDIVGLDGRPLLADPLERRRARLEEALEQGGPVLVVPAIAGEGRALHAAAVAQGIPGVIGRHRRSPYLPGIRSRLWRLVDAARADQLELTGPAASDTTADTTNGGQGEPAALDAPGGTGAGPILALIQRLPLDDA